MQGILQKHFERDKFLVITPPKRKIKRLCLWNKDPKMENFLLSGKYIFNGKIVN